MVSKLSRGLFVVALAVLSMSGVRADRDHDRDDDRRRHDVGRHNWGAVVSPVFGTSQTGTYADAELFAAPNQFNGNYYHGVLPNGRIVRPAGVSVQVGTNPLGARLTPDGKFLITSNNDEREAGLISVKNPANRGGYSLSVIDTATMTIASQINTAGKFFIGVQITGTGPYTVWASGGPDNDVKLFTVSSAGIIAVGTPAHIVIAPTLPANKGYVSNYTPGPALNTADASGNKPPVPTSFDRTAGAKITFPAGSALSKNGKFLYIACNGDNSLAVIDTATKAVVRQVPVGYFPYDVALDNDGSQVFVSNWGVTAYKFANPTYDASGVLTALDALPANEPAGYFVPHTSVNGQHPKTSSVSILDVPGGNGASATPVRSIYQGHALDHLFHVGDTHPTATALVVGKHQRVLYVTRTNDDSLGLIKLSSDHDRNSRHDDDDDDDDDAVDGVKTFDLSLVDVDGVRPDVHGTYPNALAVSPDGTRVYVAEAGINSVAVLDTTKPMHPRLLGRIPTGWYPSALAIGPNGRTLYVVNAKGIGEDVPTGAKAPASTSAAPFSNIDSNYIFGSVQKVDLASTPIDATTVARNNFRLANDLDDSVVPIGGEASALIKHVIFILHENKTFDSMLGDEAAHFGPYAASTFARPDGTTFTNHQFGPVALNTQLLARTFAAGVNYFSDAEESDAGHQFAASGTATDYTEKTLLVKSGRGLLVNKNFEPEDYPEAGYIFNNAARHGVSFKDYGALIRIAGTDTGTSAPASLNDVTSGKNGYPTNPMPLMNVGDVDSPTRGLGQSYFMTLPILAILGSTNPTGEPRLDHNYPGYNFNISDQRRALEFIKDFDRMAANHTLPRYLYIYQPNDHTGGAQATNVPPPTGAQQVEDGDVALGMVVQHIMKSPIYYNPSTREGAAIFMTYDDAQATLDHIHPHRTPVIAISPYAKPGYLGKKHYSTASIVKTEELLLGLPPSNLGDLLATDLRDLFQPFYNGITADTLTFNRVARYETSPEGRRLWALVNRLDTSAPDRDSRRLGALGRLSMAADQLHAQAADGHQLDTTAYRKQQRALYAAALSIVKGPAPRDADD
jgi:YVTN family beta-propeller protein